MKTLFGCLLLLTTFAHAIEPVQFWTGVPRFTETRTLHVDGVSVKVALIEVSDYQMGCEMNCSSGTVLYFWLQSGPAQENCSRWYSIVLTSEADHKDSEPYPYLELVTSGAPVTTDEGISYFTVGEVTCHEAVN
ncbi:MAG: hypothetical protein WBQ43_00860 [Terriglobales bacterium]